MVISNERLEELFKKKALKELDKFMEGQTVSGDGIYDDDFLRFVKKQKVID